MKVSTSRSWTRVGVVPFIAAALLLGAAVVGAGALTPPDPNQVVDKVTICHRTNSNANPYVVITPNADGDVSGHADHVGGDNDGDGPGPVWNPTLKADHIKWGDIIPPFKWSGGDFPGLNWTTDGQAIYANDCDPELPPPEAFGTLTITKLVVNPESPDVPSGGFTVHVDCDDKARDDIVIPKGGNQGTPVVIDDIEAGSTCIVTEVDPPADVSYTPSGVDTTGVVVDEEQTVAVTITNTFELPAPPIPGGETVTPAAEAVQVTPAFTG